ncbi:hypothetical protein CF165_40800 [Amycolatopsis vastitatis]|uniref:Uncharacterized protein n=1 Tax=Amycolatopsis vastitatis TaxID=1905142 RepID=A0A229SPW4_9PSEU|nr:hypothetical protein CF165_40800 [Amycolatopsis vastitatis]
MLMLPVVAAIAAAVPASAAAGPATRWLTVNADHSVSAADTGSAVTPLALTSYISNENTIGIGVSRDNVAGGYQAILPAHRRTDGSPLYWSRAVSFYIGAGGCADAKYFASGAWRPAGSFRGPVEVLTDQTIPGESVARWAVSNHRAC